VGILDVLYNMFKTRPRRELAAQAAAEERRADISRALPNDDVPNSFAPGSRTRERQAAVGGDLTAGRTSDARSHA